MNVAPGQVLGALLVVIATQITRIAAPGQGPYLWTLLLAAVGFVLGELVVAATHSGGPTLGVLHPVADAAAIAVIEVAGAVGVIVVRRRRRQP